MLPDLILDFETRSRVRLNKAGAYRYSVDPSTQVTVVSYKFAGHPNIYRWRPYTSQDMGWPLDLVSHIEGGGKVVSHGPFERIIWNRTLCRQFPFLPAIYIEQCSDLMVRAFACNLPGKLEQLAKILGGPQKDMEGHALMQKLSKPRRVNDDGTIVWWEDRDDMERQEQYCDQDVVVEDHHHSILPELTPDELELWHIDQRINDRGIPIDRQFVERAIKLVELAKHRANEEIANLTDGAVTKATQVKALVTWLNSRGVHTQTLQRGDRQRLMDLAESLEDDDATDTLELRATAGKTSTAKYKAILESIDTDDDHGRGWLQFGGAQQTMRWAGRVVQPQNFPRVTDDNEEDDITAWVVGLTRDTTRPVTEVYDLIELVGPPRLANGDKQGGMATLAWLSKALRSTIIAPPGWLFVGGDFSNIEGRINAWLAKEQWKIQAFIDYDNKVGPDLYRVAYSKAFGIEPDQVTGTLRQIGKVIELQCGYQGGVGAFLTATGTYLLKLPPLVQAISTSTPPEVWDGVAVKYDHARDKFDLDEATWTAIKVAVTSWRKTNPLIVASWWDLQDAAIMAVERPGLKVPCYSGRVHYQSDGEWLYCFLPSGRPLMYSQPHVATVEEEVVWNGVQYVDTSELWPWEIDALVAVGYKVITRKRRGVRFFGLSDTKQWVRKFLYGGYQCENIVQAVARDFMALAMKRAEQAGFELRLTVHDELLSMVKPNWYDRAHDYERFYQWLLTQLPHWAQDFPMAAKVWSGHRYAK